MVRLVFGLSLWFCRLLWRLFKSGLPVKLPKLPTYFEPLRETFQRAAVYGLSGTGKSRLLSSLGLGTIAQRLEGKILHGLIVFEVHGGSLYDYLKTRLALLALEYPEIYEIFVPVDPTNPKWTVRYDPLACTKDELPYDRAQALTDAIKTVYQDDPSFVHLERVLYHTFLTLSFAQLSLRDIPRLFRDKEFRAEILFKLNNPVLNEFWAWVPSPDKITAELRQFVDSTLNRVEALYNNPRIADFMGQPATINWRDCLQRGAIILVNADKSVLSERGAYLFCSLIMAEVLRAAFLRSVDTPEKDRRPVLLIADEYASYTNETIIKIITEARKYKVEGIFASQEVVGQGKGEALQRKILKLVQTIASFRIGAGDGQVILDDLMSLNVDQVRHIRKSWQQVFGFDTQHEEPIYRDQSSIRQLALQRLIDLPNRLFFLKERGKPGTLLLETPHVPDVEDLPNAHLIPEALEKLDRQAFARFGVLRPNPLDELRPTPNIHRETAGDSVDVSVSDPVE